MVILKLDIVNIMDFSLIIQFSVLCVTVLGLFFSYHRWRENVMHSRIDNLKSDIQDKIEHIEENYAKRSELTNSVDNVKEILTDMKGEYRRINDRMDELFKWMMENVGKNKNVS